ncbi:MAG: LysR family transcriptional regulator [Elusimicrobia bacterium]|nr:LysR family transcriptional regulator [Elusimicrobiota bacterium]
MIPINYHHLYYFWITAKLERIGAASRRLYLAQPTLSLQIKQLERSLGRRLFERSRRGVRLTQEGRIAFDYCERIFSQGDELVAALQPGRTVRPALFRLGVAGPISRYVVLQILERAYGLNRRIRTSILGGSAEGLREQLEKHKLDLVVSNVDFSPQMGVEFRSRLAGTIPVYFVAPPRLKAKIRRFPADLSKLPMLLMAPENPVRKEVDQFLWRHKISVLVETEIEDAELIRFLALRGQGVAAMDALTARNDLARRRLVALHRKAVGVKECVWFISGRHPKPNPILQRVIQNLMGNFVVRV